MYPLVGTPHGVEGCLPPDVLPSPPPCGWSIGFIAMNPIDHPHGGGEGRTSGGRHPSTPWGVPTKGYKTRKNTRSDNLIVRRRGKRN